MWTGFDMSDTSDGSMTDEGTRGEDMPTQGCRHGTRKEF